MNVLIRGVARLGAMACLAAGATEARSAPAEFILDAPASPQTVSGNIGGFPIQEQGPGSLTTTFGGNMLVNLSPSSAQFVNGGLIDANINGAWQPQPGGVAGFAPADFAGQLNLGIFGIGRLAVRNLTSDSDSPDLPITHAPTMTFPAAGIHFTLASGVIDYNSAVATGSEDIAGDDGDNQTTASATLSVATGTTPGTVIGTLAFPTQATFNASSPLGPATLNFNGQITARVLTIPGDTNFDRVVNITDFANLAANFNTGVSWLQGNFDGVGNTTIADFSLLASNFNRTAPEARGVVPEPGVAVVALLAAGLGMRRRSR